MSGKIMEYNTEEPIGSAGVTAAADELDEQSLPHAGQDVDGVGRFTGTALGLLAAQVVLMFAVLLVPQDFLKSYACLFYLVHYCLFLPFFFASRDRCAFLFSPSFLVISYICISFAIGSFAFSAGYVLSPREFAEFHQWNHYNVATLYFMVCNVVVALAYHLARKKRPQHRVDCAGGNLRSYVPHLICGGAMLLIFSAIGLRLPFLGGSGNFGIIPKVFGSLAVAIALTKARWRYRSLVYVGLLLVFAATQFNNRRIVIVFILSLIFVESAHLRDLRVSLRVVFLCAVVLALAVLLQITMTLTRGVAGFKGSYWQAFHEIRRFTSLKNVTTYSLKTTEGPAIFFHSYNGVEYVMDDHSLLCYGSTLLKALFIGVPRSMWPNKPQSVVHWYTYRWDPKWRRAGCSACVSLYTDYFWNFHILGWICALPIFYFFNRGFFFYLDRLRAGTVWPFLYLGVGYYSVLIYARGQCLDGLAIFLVFALLAQWVLFNPFVAVLRSESRKREPDGAFLTGTTNSDNQDAIWLWSMR